MFVSGRAIQAFGPFKCQIEIGPNPVTIDVFLTGDASFGHRYILGQDAWGALAIKVVGTPPQRGKVEDKGSYNEAHVRMCGTGDSEKVLKTLVDTGAGPNVMSKEAYLSMGYDLEQLESTTYHLTMADDSSMRTLGKAKSLPMTIAEKFRVTPDFVICEHLGGDDAILGREFLIKYDVALDLPRQRMEIRNPNTLYCIEAHLESKKISHQYVASVRRKVNLPGENIECVKMKVQPVEKSMRGARVHYNGSWLAQIDGEKGSSFTKKGIGIPSAIITVRDGEALIALCNARGASTPDQRLTPGTGKVRVRPVEMRYRRVYYEAENSDSNDSVIMKIDAIGNAVIEEDEAASLAQTAETGATSEVPIILKGETIKGFQTKA